MPTTSSTHSGSCVTPQPTSAAGIAAITSPQRKLLTVSPRMLPSITLLIMLAAASEMASASAAAGARRLSERSYSVIATMKPMVSTAWNAMVAIETIRLRIRAM